MSFPYDFKDGLPTFAEAAKVCADFAALNRVPIPNMAIDRGSAGNGYYDPNEKCIVLCRGATPVRNPLLVFSGISCGSDRVRRHGPRTWALSPPLAERSRRLEVRRRRFQVVHGRRAAGQRIRAEHGRIHRRGRQAVRPVRYRSISFYDAVCYNESSRKWSRR